MFESAGIEMVFYWIHFVFILHVMPSGEAQSVTSEPIFDVQEWFNDTFKQAVRKEKWLQ